VAHRPEDLYAEVRGVAPDLLVYFGDLYWRSVGQVGTGTVHVFENDTGPDDANHAHEGLYVLAGDGVPAGSGPERSLHDVAPTLLELLGEPVPAEMEGRSMLLPPAGAASRSHALRHDSVTDTHTLSQ
jgi:predicted AlkP superfamily phosphohydrolase/phosphomutase